MPEQGTGLWSKLFGWAERFGNIWSFVSGLGVISMGALAAWAAWAADLLAQYAPFSWVAAGILGGLAVATAMLAVSAFRLKWAQASATNKWKEATAGINPLEDTFRSQRINILDLVSPMKPEIKNKTFIDCELVGPINLAMSATRPGSGGFNGTAFSACDWVIVRNDALLLNAVMLLDCNFLRGTVFKATFYIPFGQAQMLSQKMPDLPWLNGPLEGPRSGTGPTTIPQSLKS